MANKRRFLTFRTKPRSPIKSVEWFEYFARLEGQNYEKRNDNGNYPVRRTYVKLAHPEIDFSKTSDPESNARQEKAIYELLGLAYVNEEGEIIITQAGNEIIENENKRDELMLRQLLKYQYPNFVNSTSRYKNMRVFLMEIVIKMLDKLEYLNRYEAAISLMFCCRKNEINKSIEIVKEYRSLIAQEDNKNDATMLEKFNYLADKYYSNINMNKIDSHLTTMDALFRFLEYTSLFIQSGRGNFSKISIREMAKEKVDLLLKEYDFDFNKKWDDCSFFEEYGDPYSKSLPWDEKDNLYGILVKDLIDIKDKIEKYKIDKENEYYKKVNSMLNDLEDSKDNHKKLQVISDKVRDLTISIEEDIFIYITSKQRDKRDEILDTFDNITKERSMETSLALWFENNFWKSLTALNGDHKVKRNFKVEPDLSPRFFAPGIGNTPDLEFYNDEFIIIGEVTLTQGTQQWKAEGGSVVDHINSFHEVKLGLSEEKKGEVIIDDSREIIGLFIAKEINNRVMWLFYALNNNSWINQPMPIIPLKLNNYVDIMKKLYNENIEAIYFEKFLWTLHREAKACDNVKEWEENMEKKVKSFIDDPKLYVEYNY